MTELKSVTKSWTDGRTDGQTHRSTYAGGAHLKKGDPKKKNLVKIEK